MVYLFAYFRHDFAVSCYRKVHSNIPRTIAFKTKKPTAHSQVGRGVAHEEQVYFTVSRGRLIYGDDESAIQNGNVRLEFIKGYRDNPKINAVALFRGDVENVPQLAPIVPDSAEDSFELADAMPASKTQLEQERQRRRRYADGDNDDDDDMSEYGGGGSERQQRSFGGADGRGGGGGGGGASVGGGAGGMRKTSGPKQEDPYALDDSTVMLPVFIAIGAFIPMLFCLCRL